jgi:Zn-finger nucleic acid-binding protein
MKCPVCVEETLVISSREGVEIDHCPQCRGVWLDRGELDKIIDRASPSAPARDDRSRGNDRYDDRDRDRDRDRDHYDDRDRDYGKKRKRRGSFLEDLFDFD